MKIINTYLSKYRTFFFNYSSIYFFFKIMEIHKKNIILIFREWDRLVYGKDISKIFIII